MDSTPVSLLEQLRQPHQTVAWQRFAELYTPLLYYWGRGQGLSEADSADLVQEVFVVLVQKLPTFRYDRDGSFRAWLRTVTLNKHREMRRKVATVQLAPDFDHAGDDPRLVLDEAEHRRHVVQRMLDLLRPEIAPATWRLFDAYVLQGRKPGEVAARWNVTPGTVYAAKCEVLHRLRRELDGLLD